MKFMIIVRATRDSEAGVMPPDSLIAEMGRFHEELYKAGVLRDASGLQPSSKGWRVKYAKGSPRRTVVDGPFAETKELIAGYTIIEVKTREEALEWTRRFPNPFPENAECEIEVRQFFDIDNFEPSQAVEDFKVLQKELEKSKS
jgi:hypothetical protein